MEIKTTQQITGRLTRPNERNQKWVAVDDLIKYIDDEIAYFKSHLGKNGKTKENEIRTIRSWIYEAECIKSKVLSHKG